ncbi:MAG: hypothetical protein K2Z25_01430 [Beijerinckiaceae bacterium]|nr:hypothetical protein [Beijerinckiaceae bacterium]
MGHALLAWAGRTEAELGRFRSDGPELGKLRLRRLAGRRGCAGDHVGGGQDRQHQQRQHETGRLHDELHFMMAPWGHSGWLEPRRVMLPAFVWRRAFWFPSVSPGLLHAARRYRCRHIF